MNISIKREYLYYALAGIGAVILLWLVFFAGKKCGADTIPVVAPTVDTSAVQANEQAKAREVDVKAAQQIKQLETAHQEDIQEFTTEQRQEYEAIRKQGPRKVAAWLAEFNKELKKNP